jgi:predicted phosphoadenosine phosphosulfate sulfurtransferase
MAKIGAILWEKQVESYWHFFQLRGITAMDPGCYHVKNDYSDLPTWKRICRSLSSSSEAFGDGVSG